MWIVRDLDHLGPEVAEQHPAARDWVVAVVAHPASTTADNPSAISKPGEAFTFRRRAVNHTQAGCIP
jgi:hypothetical protein